MKNKLLLVAALCATLIAPVQVMAATTSWIAGTNMIDSQSSKVSAGVTTAANAAMNAAMNAVHTEHNFTQRGVETDVCKECGYERMHYTSMDLPFVGFKENAVCRSEPRKSGAVTRSISDEENITIVGRIRNESNNVWGLTDMGDYVYLENVAVDFDYLLVQAYENSCIWTEEIGVTLDGMYNLFKTGGSMDLKNINMLGSGKNSYKIKVGGKVRGKKYTGEELGNIVYGYCAAALGMKETAALRVGGAGAHYSNGDYGKAAVCLASGIGCDSKEDQRNIIRGMKYFETGKWS